MDITAGITARNARHLVTQLAGYRHKVFVERLGWPLEDRDGLEFDQFDREDTVYVVAQNQRADLTGCARLLPTTRPCLLSEVFPQLMGDAPMPRSDQVWELSRFAAVDLARRDGSTLSRFSSPQAVELLRACLRCAQQHGARRLITVSPLGIERLLRHAGFAGERAAPPMQVDGQWLFACWIYCDPVQ